MMEKSMENSSSPINVANAGLVIFNPYLPRLFRILGFIEDSTRLFKSKDEQIRAVFVLQALCDEEHNREYNETELVFNKLLTGLPLDEPLPRSIQLTSEELTTIDGLLTAIQQNWDKMRNTSKRGLIESFIKRKGSLTEERDKLVLTVENKAYDILLDSIPWSFNIIRFPWMSKLIQVSWR